MTTLICLLAIHYSPFVSSFLPYSLLATRYSLLHSLPPTRGVRSAGGARMHARHPSRHAMTGMQTPLSMRKPGEPALRSLRTTGGPGVRSICASRTSRLTRGVLRSQRRDARLSALHVGFLARARARRCPAFPPGSCGNLICRTGHRYPEERVSRTSPARPLTASGDTTTSLRLTETPPEAPLWSEAGRYIA